MKTLRLLLACTCGLALALILMMALGQPRSKKALAAPTATTRYVQGNVGADTTDCTSSQAPCKTIQHALAQAVDGDTVRVAKALYQITYTGTVVITKSITLEGGWGATGSGGGLLWLRLSPCDASWTIIDGGGGGRVISITGNITPTIDCFTITGGDATGLGGDPRTASENDAGGGIYSRDAAPVIVNNIITANTAWTTHTVALAGSMSVLGGGECGRGGGVYLLNAPATAVISGNLIANNVADKSSCGHGGGIALRDSDAQVLHNTIDGNRASSSSGGWGGGFAVEGGEPTIADNEFLYNTGGEAVYGCGGGLSVYDSPLTTIERNRLQGNKALVGTGSVGMAAQGGGICVQSSPIPRAVIVRNNVLSYNVAAPQWLGEGGGMYFSGLITPSLVSGNTLHENVGGFNVDGGGGGIYVDDSEVTISDNDIFENRATWSGDYGVGGGIRVDGGTVLIQGNAITRNYAAFFPGFPATAKGYGGGVAILGGQTTVQGNQIVENRGTNSEDLGMGGGIYGESGTLEIVGNTIAENRASILDNGHGGGVALSETVAIVRGNWITGNQATSDTMGTGGGIHGFLGTLQISANTIAENRATRANPGKGGGVYLEETLPWLEGNTILDNEAAAGTTGRGGGVRIDSCPLFTLTNNIIARNDASHRGSGVAIIANSTGQLVHNTIAENVTGDGVGVHVNLDSDVTLDNNIIVSQTVGITVADVGISTVVAQYTLFEDNGTDYGAGVNSSYEVAGPAALLPDYHLGAGSNAIDAGISVGWVTDDIDGDLRSYGSAPDVGADEFACLARLVTTDYLVIQEAIDDATSGQTVQVAEGTCYENLSIDKTVTLEGGWDVGFSSRYTDPATHSTIDGSGSGRVISITETSGSIAPTIDGFTITGGDATGLGGATGYTADIGGGIYSWYADTTVSNCIIIDNVASTSGIAWGGGMAVLGGSTTLQDSTLVDNTASTGSSGYGGGACFRFGTSILDGNTVENNTASTVDNGYGGGLWLANSSSTMQGSTVRGNTASIAHKGRGGGVDICMGSANLDGDVIAGNRAVVSGLNGYGGGISTRDGASVTIDDAQIHHNTATFGGGGYFTGTHGATLANVQVYSNTAGMGGGVYINISDDTTITRSAIYNNVADYAGGIYLNSSDNASLTGNHIQGNEAWGLGGGLWVSSSDNAWLENNMITDNRLTSSGDGAGVHVFLNSTTHFLHTTLARNGGGNGHGMYVVDSSTAWMTNTIVASHTVGIYASSGCTITLEATLWGDGDWENVSKKGGSGTIDDGEIIVVGDPGFLNPEAGNYHIRSGSEAIDAGLGAGVDDDIDGDPRPIGAGYDIGADEARPAFLPLVMRDYP
jgi:hypothetical protein